MAATATATKSTKTKAAPKKAATSKTQKATTTKAKAEPSHPSWKDIIKVCYIRTGTHLCLAY